MRSTVAAVCLFAGLAACGEEPPPRSAQEFVEDPILLEATMVRCSRDRAATRYDAECVNARDAVDRIAAVREQARREELEAQSERKREALRRAHRAAAAARQRAEEAARRREEADNFGEFEPLLSGEEAAPDDDVPEQDRNDGAAAGAAPPSARDRVARNGGLLQGAMTAIRAV